MRSTLPLAALGVLPIALALAPRSAQEHEEAPVDVERLFRTSCAMCHPAPDLRFAADRAWLEQVHDTA